MREVMDCPNCGQHKADETHPETGCVLATLIGVVRDRGGLSESEVAKLHRTCNVDALWDRLGPVIDELEAGEFSDDED